MYIMWSLKNYRRSLRQQRWDNEYESGKWDYMQSIEELGRYSVIAGYATYLKAKSVLDVGCGDGNLIRLLPLMESYVGVDISPIALTKAQEAIDTRPNYCLIESDFDTYLPTNKFDLVVFGESLYYSRHPLQTLVSYQNALANGGHCVISMYKNLKAPPIWEMVNDIFDILDETHIHQRNQGWIIRLLIPKQK